MAGLDGFRPQFGPRPRSSDPGSRPPPWHQGCPPGGRAGPPAPCQVAAAQHHGGPLLGQYPGRLESGAGIGAGDDRHTAGLVGKRLSPHVREAWPCRSPIELTKEQKMSTSRELTFRHILSTLFSWAATSRPGFWRPPPPCSCVRLPADHHGRSGQGRGDLPARTLPAFLQQGAGLRGLLRGFRDLLEGIRRAWTPADAPGEAPLAFELWAVRPFGFFEASPELRGAPPRRPHLRQGGHRPGHRNLRGRAGGHPRAPERHGAREGAAPRADRPGPHPRRPRLQGGGDEPPRSSGP